MSSTRTATTATTLRSRPVLALQLDTSSLLQAEGRTGRVRAPIATVRTDVRVSATLSNVTPAKAGVSCRDSGPVDAPDAIEGLATSTHWYVFALKGGARTLLATGAKSDPGAPKATSKQIAEAIRANSLEELFASFRTVELSCTGGPGQPGRVRFVLDTIPVADLDVASMPPAGTASVVIWAERDVGATFSTAHVAEFKIDTTT
jgi:hypothetical protein